MRTQLQKKCQIPFDLPTFRVQRGKFQAPPSYESTVVASFSNFTDGPTDGIQDLVMFKSANDMYGGKSKLGFHSTVKFAQELVDAATLAMTRQRIVVFRLFPELELRCGSCERGNGGIAASTIRGWVSS